MTSVTRKNRTKFLRKLYPAPFMTFKDWCHHHNACPFNHTPGKVHMSNHLSNHDMYLAYRAAHSPLHTYLQGYADQVSGIPYTENASSDWQRGWKSSAVATPEEREADRAFSTLMKGTSKKKAAASVLIDSIGKRRLMKANRKDSDPIPAQKTNLEIYQESSSMGYKSQGSTWEHAEAGIHKAAEEDHGTFVLHL